LSIAHLQAHTSSHLPTTPPPTITAPTPAVSRGLSAALALLDLSSSHEHNDKLPGEVDHTAGAAMPRRPGLPSGGSSYRSSQTYRRQSQAPTGSQRGMDDVSSPAALTAHFRAYVRQLNQRLPSTLRLYLAPRISYNGRRISADAFAAQACPPGATVSSEMVVADISKRLLAARIEVEVHHQTPSPSVNGTGTGGSPLESPQGEEPRRGSSSSVEHVREHVFYHFDEQWRIDEVWSVAEPRSESPKSRSEKGRERLERRRMSIPSGFEDYRF
jgi:predicted ester cyclase